MKEKCQYCGRYPCICRQKKEHQHTSCSHGHCHSEQDKEKKTDIYFYILSIIVFILSLTIVKPQFRMVSYLIVILLAGYELIMDGIRNLLKFNFEESTLMTIAVIAAFILGEYPEACMVVLLYRIGEFLEEKAVSKSQKNIEDIVKIKTDTANVLDEKEDVIITLSEEVKVGDKILIKPGEQIPLDCIVLSGNSNIDTSAITGESIPISVGKNDELLSGSINLSGAIIAKVERDYQNSTATQIVDLVYEAVNNKGDTEKFITKFSKVYTPVVILLALLLAFIPPLFTGFDFATWISRSLIFLVASCPCSIIISIPLAMFSGVGTMSKRGLLLKGTKHIENLSKAKVIAFDKTGTLTTGKMKLDRIEVIGNYSEQKILEYIVNMEKISNHPISEVFTSQEVEKLKIENYLEIAGHGISCIIQGKEMILGNKKMLEKDGIHTENIKNANMYLAIDKEIVAFIFLEEEIEQENQDIVEQLTEVGIQRIVMLTGDNKASATKIAEKLKISEVYGELLPQDKQNKIEQIKQEKQKVIFVGDGINDSPVLAAADLGISMGLGTQIANSISDSILMTNHIHILPKCIHIAKKTMGIVKFNMIFSLLVKLIVLTLGVFGLAPIWSAILADTGITMFTVMNSIRIIKMK